jgi:HPt (histidine-containing phosphotransfer) domain-containing protein
MTLIDCDGGSPCNRSHDTGHVVDFGADTVGLAHNRWLNAISSRHVSVASASPWRIENRMNDLFGKSLHGDVAVMVEHRLRNTDQEGCEPTVDQDCQGELLDLVGEDKVLELLTRLAADLHARLRSAEPETLRADAHCIVSAAGLLGFAALSAAARRLEHAIEAGADLAIPLSRLLSERSAAIGAMTGASARLVAKSARRHTG